MAPAETKGSIWTREAGLAGGAGDAVSAGAGGATGAGARGAAGAGRLTREAIVAAAIALADAQGIDAVSIRRVAAELQARPMSLYSHIARKDDLIDLMLDAVVEDSLLPEVPADWRAALRAIAAHTRGAALRHPWVATAYARRTGLGPNAVRHLEQSLAALASLDVDDARKIAILRAVDTYTLGNVATEQVLAQAALEGGSAGRSAWRELERSYLERLATSGDHPHLAALGSLDEVIGVEDFKASFAEGLEWLLSGIALSLDADRRG